MFENETPKYYKKAEKKVPVKSDHIHSYVRPFAMAYLRLGSGVRSESKHRLYLQPFCIDCGHVGLYRKKRLKNFLEVEISLSEYRQLKSN